MEARPTAAASVDELYRQHAPEVYRYAYAVLGNQADAEDVTQTTFVNALRAIERGDEPRKPSNWLITIAHNIVRQRFRQQGSRPAEVALDGDIESPPHGDDEGHSLDELVRALQRIPASQREALVMRELEGRSYKEIAEITGVTPGALETLLFRARRSLAEEIENLVTCERAELAISQQVDGRLSRKERKRLNAHLRECQSCARVEASQSRYRTAFKSLALVPLPLSMTLFKGAPSASAATGLSTIGAGATAVATGSSTGAVLAGSVAAKVAIVAAAVAVTGGAGYEGASNLRHHAAPGRAQTVLKAHVRSSGAVRPFESTARAGRSAAHARVKFGLARHTNAGRHKAKRTGQSKHAVKQSPPRGHGVTAGTAASNSARAYLAPQAHGRPLVRRGRPKTGSVLLRP